MHLPTLHCSHCSNSITWHGCMTVCASTSSKCLRFPRILSQSCSQPHVSLWHVMRDAWYAQIMTGWIALGRNCESRWQFCQKQHGTELSSPPAVHDLFGAELCASRYHLLWTVQPRYAQHQVARLVQVDLHGVHDLSVIAHRSSSIWRQQLYLQRAIIAEALAAFISCTGRSSTVPVSAEASNPALSMGLVSAARADIPPITGCHETQTLAMV